MSTPTPRTDAEEVEAFIGVSTMDSSDVQKAYDFARQLERELAVATNHIEQLGITLHKSERELAEANANYKLAHSELGAHVLLLGAHKTALVKAWKVFKTSTNEEAQIDEESRFLQYLQDWDDAKAAINEVLK